MATEKRMVINTGRTVQRTRATRGGRMEQPATIRDAFSHDLQMPDHWASGVIVCSPHSGRDYPDWFLTETCLDVQALRSSEDAFMDELIQPALEAGAVTLTARLPRSIVDLNRGASELDPEAVDCGRSRPTTPRAIAGLGVIPVLSRVPGRSGTRRSRWPRRSVGSKPIGAPITRRCAS